MSNENINLDNIIKSNTRIKGVVDWYRYDKGYGVISCIIDNIDCNIFVYYTNIKHNTPLIPMLIKGESVEFQIYKTYTNNTIRYHAKNVSGHSGRKLQFERQYDLQSKEIDRNNLLYDVNKTSVANVTPNIRILTNLPKNGKINDNDLVIINNVFDFSAEDILSELNEIHLNIPTGIWKLWHAESHLIADDYINFKSQVKLFNNIVNHMQSMFDVDIKATRLNMYTPGDCKPFHQDASGFKKEVAINQNISITASFGKTRSVLFKHVKTSTIIEIPLESGCVYAFGKNVNLDWYHGIPPNNFDNTDHTSIVIWGYQN